MRVASSVWFPRAGTIELRDEELPRLGPDDVRVRALVSALSHGTELLVFRGQVPPDLALDLPTLRGSFAFPIKYGYASVGQVIEVGDAVRDPRPGDLVFVHHPHQTEYVVPAARCLRLPSEIEPEAGVFLANLETAINIVLDARPRLGERVVIFGQGVVGLLLTQLVRRTGADVIVAVDPIPNRRELARNVGADVGLAPDDQLAPTIRELTAGVGADLVVEASGNERALAQAIEVAGTEGSIVVSSWYGTKPVTLPLGGTFHRRRLRISSSQVSSLDPSLLPRWTFARRLELARDLLARLQLQPLISHRIPFDRAALAYDLIDRQPEDVVQVVLTYANPIPS